MSGLEINTKKLGEIYKEWRGNESCYDNGRPVFEADELLDFAQFCLKHEANVIPTGESQSNIPDVSGSLPSPEDVKRWYQLLIGKGEEAMYKDMRQ